MPIRKCFLCYTIITTVGRRCVSAIVCLRIILHVACINYKHYSVHTCCIVSAWNLHHTVLYLTPWRLGVSCPKMSPRAKHISQWIRHLSEFLPTYVRINYFNITNTAKPLESVIFLDDVNLNTHLCSIVQVINMLNLACFSWCWKVRRESFSPSH